MKNNKGGKRYSVSRKGIGGAKSKYKKVLENIKVIQYLYEIGLTDKEVSEKINIAESTLHDYKLKHPEFSESIKESKEFYNKQVVDSVLKSTIGFEFLEEHKEYKGGVDKKGKPIGKLEKVKTIKKYYAPNTTAQIFWLCNRDRENWRQRQEITGADGQPLVTGIKVEIVNGKK